MKNHSTSFTNPSPGDEAIEANGIHASREIGEFPIEEVETSIQERFEKIVRLYPNQIAVKSDSHAVTYAELNTMANSVARILLTQRGNEPEAIALLLSKDASLMAAMLGVLKAGKFFILLDSSFPNARNVALLEDSQAGLVIADRANASLAGDIITSPSRVLEFESTDLSIFTDNLGLDISPEALATVLYTSGSTGEPKGIICNHRDLLHRVMLRRIENQAGEHDRIALLPTGTANTVTNSLFALLNGATLCPFDTQKEGVIRLAKWLAEEEITICAFSSSLFRSFAGVLTEKETFPALRIVRLRSETVHRGDIDLYSKYFPVHCTFVTGLSSSETGQLTTYLLNDTIKIPADGVPLGYPVQDKEILVLDDAGNEVGANQVGEIVVRSRYLAVGYWRRPELTAAKFKADPKYDGQRLCFTGDLGLRLPDGCLVHKGRKDFRVKIRGYGVELAEVESRLLDHSAIKEAVVVARQTESGDAHLVAYYTVRGHSANSVGGLRSFLESKLPLYMIPSVFVLLDAMPLTPNGKIDRTALPRHENCRPDLNTVYTAPRTPEEKKLVKILAALLGIDPIGTDDNFFDLGGDSLLAGRLTSRIWDEFHVDVPLIKFLESPTIADLGKFIERAELGNKPAKDFSIRPAARTETLPVSFSQRRLWFLDQLFPQSFAYNMLSAYRLTGRLDVTALKKSINEIVRRHEVWRTVFKAVDGEPRQVVLPNLSLELTVVDLREIVSEADPESEVRCRFETEAQAPFDLAHGPLVRASLLRSKEDEYVLLLTKHHIVYDGWCRGIIARELTALYEAFSNSQPSPLKELPIQYSDYAAWQRQWFQGEVLEDQLSFWKKQLENFQTLQLPTDRPRPSVQTNRGARHYFALPATLSAALKELSREHDVTLFITLLAAFKTLLHRYTGQTDILVGSPVAGRNRSELENLIGFFLNTLPLRTDLSGSPTFKRVLALVREVCFGAYAHQDLPFEKLVEELRPERDLSRNPLFQVGFTLQNTPRCPLELAGLKAEELEIYSGITRFDLELYLEEGDYGLQGYVNYNADLFDEATMIRMLERFQTLLTGIIADPGRRISDLPILTEAERHQLLVEWNDTKRDYPKDQCIHKLFETQVEKTPDATALVFEDQQVTYRELNNRANQLAHYLRKFGVGPEVLVGICVERSIEMVVGLLGILKAGGGYVPLDVNYPAERLEFMLADAQVSVLLTQSDLFEDGESRLDDSDGRSSSLDRRVQRICLDRDWELITRESDANLGNIPTADNLAYVIYTSGSTGQPKGVAIEHRNTVGFLSWVHSTFTQEELSGVLASTSICFDLSVFEIFAPLTCGGMVILAQDALALARIPNRTKVSLLNTVPSAMNELLNLVAIPQSVRVSNLAGEPLRTDLVRRIYESTSVRKVHDLYGPTEGTTYSTWTCRTPNGLQTIGRPIANTQVYILDGSLNPVPVGVVGELHIGGDGLARGYLNRPELTSEKFIPNPLSADPTSRLYKTGDLSRYLPDGNIEFLGRIDHQVKIRGYRIELGEIEAVLGQHPAVREAVVLAREDSPGERRLVAYVIAAPGLAPSANELRSFLQQKVPQYMVPSVFMFLDSLPLTPNGKVDRKALPAPDQSRPELGESYSGPCTPVEELLANIWAEVLKLDKVGIHDNFFHLGGHSLLATRVVSRVREAFQVELPLRTLFESPTVAGLAGQMEATYYKESNITPAPMVPVVRDKKLSLSFSQQRLWFLDQYEPNSSVYKMSSAHRLRGALDVAALEQSLGEIVRRHEALRTRFSVEGGEPVQVIAPAGNISLSVVDLSHFFESDREGEAQRLATAEARRPFDLSEGPLFRASVLRLSEEDHVLLCTMHHIVSDGWSMGVLNRELSVLYQAFTQDKPSPLPDLPIQYADYAVWQREWLKGEELERQLSYWKKQLEGAPGVLNLPTDRPRPALQSHRGARQSITLSKDLSEKLKVMSRKEGVTLYMTLLAAFQTLLYRYTGQEDVVVGSPIANRTRTEIEGLIGFFVNTLVLRSNFSNNPTFKALLARVRVTALGAYTHQDLPFEKLVEELHPERSLSHSPLFQVLFNMVNQENFKLDLPGLTTARLSFSEAESKFDLTFYVKEQNDVISFNLVYRVDLFSESWVTCFLQQYRYLLEQIVSDPEKPVRSYSLVTPESGVLLPDPSAVLAEPLQQLVTDAFLSWAKKTPARTAITQGEHTWTYEQLGERADTIGRALKVSGLEPGAVVAVHGRRSLGLIAAMIGTLLSGGVLLLIDHHLPIQRKQLMLKEGRARKILFIGDGDKGWVNADKPIDSLSIEARTGLIIDFDSSGDLKTTSLPGVSPHDPAYIFFTSGTTGIPKAVLGCHKGLSHFLKWQRETFAIEPNDRVAQLMSLSFDAVLRDIFLPLTSGATLCLPELNDHPDSDGMIGWLEHERISVLHTVPSLAESWLASAVRPCSLSDMRWVFFVGEPLTDALVRQWRSTFQSAAMIVNLYGPTETTLVKCFYRVPADMRSGVQPVGSPITETQALVLAHDNQLCGVNEPGEIVLRTPFRSLGYVNAPEESQKRFVKNPFRDDAEDLIYFTGDVGRYRPDRTLEILGRLDDQVKIRGVRVEPAEVTAILSQHPLVASGVVVGKKNEQGETCLVVYVVASEQGPATTAQLRAYLLDRLPAAMVPSAFVFLDSLPLTPNGKLDRKALPEPDHRRSEPELGFVAPRTELEKIVAGVWAEVLKLERVGVHDNFFDAGGHSLLATQTLSRIRAALQVDLSVRALFEKPTVASLCEHIEATRWAGKTNQPNLTDNCDETEEMIL
jgi:amino acid adenylation domain-containing protein